MDDYKTNISFEKKRVGLKENTKKVFRNVCLDSCKMHEAKGGGGGGGRGSRGVYCVLFVQKTSKRKTLKIIFVLEVILLRCLARLAETCKSSRILCFIYLSLAFSDFLRPCF